LAHILFGNLNTFGYLNKELFAKSGRTLKAKRELYCDEWMDFVYRMGVQSAPWF
jgi:hypothetical protein